LITCQTEDREILKLEEMWPGLEHPQTLLTCYNLATWLMFQGKLDEAKVFAQRAAEGAQKVLGASHPHTLMYQKLWQKLQTTNSQPQP
jgi:hypothetical protein